jgi:hypothetical protein
MASERTYTFHDESGSQPSVLEPLVMMLLFSIRTLLEKVGCTVQTPGYVRANKALPRPPAVKSYEKVSFQTYQKSPTFVAIRD